MLTPLDDKAKAASFAQGFLENWAKNEPPQLRDYLTDLVNGLDYWRQKYYAIVEDYQKLNANYTNLTVAHGQLLQEAQFLRDQNTELLVESQKEFHAPRTQKTNSNLVES